MKEYRFQDVGFQNLTLNDAAPLQATGNSIVVSMRAFSLNYRDILVAENRYGVKDMKGLCPLSDGVGIVKAVGPEVSAFSQGDRVVTSFFRDWISGAPTPVLCSSDLGGHVDGILAEEILLPEHALVLAPQHLQDIEAATLSCAGVTAYNALVSRGNLAAGETVLTLGSGGVSHFAIRIAATLGAHVIATTSNETKSVWLKELGAEQILNYSTTPEWDVEVKKLTGGRGVDHVVEVGGIGTLGMSMSCLAMGGHLAYIGVLTGTEGAINPFPLLAKSARLDGIYVGSRHVLEELCRFLEQHQVHPHIDRVFDFYDAQQAYAYLKSGQHKGKVVIAVH